MSFVNGFISQIYGLWNCKDLLQKLYTPYVSIFTHANTRLLKPYTVFVDV